MHGEVFDPSTHLILRVAYLHYHRGESQGDIAKKLSVSPSTISRLLKRAREERIVTFVIPQPYLECIEIGDELQRRYGLKEAIVAPPQGTGRDPEETKRAVALEGARYVQRVITDRDVLGVAWGGTMYHVIGHLNPCRKTANEFVALHGSIDCCDPKFDAKALASRLSMAFGGHPFSLEARGLFGCAGEMRAMRRQKDINAVFEKFQGVTLSLSGVGSLHPQADSPLARMGYLEDGELKELRHRGVYGDLVLRFFDREGRECDSSLRERTLAIDLETYRNIPTKIIVVSGMHKIETLRAVIRGNLVDVLIVDRELGKGLLHDPEKSTGKFRGMHA